MTPRIFHCMNIRICIYSNRTDPLLLNKKKCLILSSCIPFLSSLKCVCVGGVGSLISRSDSEWWLKNRWSRLNPSSPVVHPRSTFHSVTLDSLMLMIGLFCNCFHDIACFCFFLMIGLFCNCFHNIACFCFFFAYVLIRRFSTLSEDTK